MEIVHRPPNTEAPWPYGPCLMCGSGSAAHATEGQAALDLCTEHLAAFLNFSAANKA